jgi:protocatechuate 3,4-dioxygenase beta subunit
VAMWFGSIFVPCLLAVAAVAQQTASPTANSANSTKAPTDPKDLATLEGRTLALDGSPLRKSTLTLRPVSTKPGEPNQPYTTTSDAEGKFIFDGVEAGKYYLSGKHVGYSNSSYGAKKAGNSPTTLTLGAGQHIRQVEFTLVLQSVMTGRVLDDDGDPVAGAPVQILRQAYMNGRRQVFPSGSGQTDESGIFKLSSLLPGRYYLSAGPSRDGYFYEGTRRAAAHGDSQKPEEQLITTYYPGVTDLASATQLEVIAGRDMPGIDIRLHKSQVFRIKGTVGSAEPGQRLLVSVMRRDSIAFNFGGPSSTVAGKDGSFELHDVAPGSYNLVAMNAQGIMTVLARQPIDIGSRNVDGVALVAQPGGSLRGTVKLEQSFKPGSGDTPPDLSSVRLNLIAAVSVYLPDVPVKSDGTFTLDKVIPDKYRVALYALPDGTYVKSIRLGGQVVRPDSLDLTGGVGAAPLEIVVSASAGEINGSVQNDHQQPATGAMITVVPDPLDPDQFSLYKSGTTDQNGQFSVKNLTPGKYRVYAWEEIENGSQFDPDFMKPLEGLGTKITVEENSRLPLTLTLITSVQMEQSKPK